MRQIGVAVIGCGIWGINNAGVYKGLDEVELGKVANTDPSRRRLAERRSTAR